MFDTFKKYKDEVWFWVVVVLLLVLFCPSLFGLIVKAFFAMVTAIVVTMLIMGAIGYVLYAMGFVDEEGNKVECRSA